MFENTNIIVTVLFLCAAGFVAAFVDAIAGGGGLISLPAYFMIGFPPHFTLGTNKFSSTCGAITSTIRYAKSGKTDKSVLKVLLPFSFIGATLGVYVVLLIDSTILKPMVLIMILAVGIYSFFSKNIGTEDNFQGTSRKTLIIGAVFAFVMGFYDGFFGPGTGSFIIFGLIKIYGFDFVRASGNAKAMNFVSNITSLVMFALGGRIYYLMGLPMAIFMVIGANFGAKLAIRQGAKVIRPVFITMSLAVAVKMLYEMMI